MLASGFSKLVASSITYPHEVVRSQMHIKGVGAVTRFACGSAGVLGVLKAAFQLEHHPVSHWNV